MNKKKNYRSIVLACAQPNNRFHFGNFIGAIKNWVDLQDDHECFYGLADMHVLTTHHKSIQLRDNVLSSIAQYISFGLDPKKCNIFLQSHVLGHSELAWIFSCLVSVQQLSRMNQLKEKSKKSGAVNAGLMYYPIMQAADILIYNADIVPVGDDQKQHIELTKTIARKFNNKYSDLFHSPSVLSNEFGSRVMSLQNLTKKMSKSDPNPNGSLFLLDEPSVLKKKIMRSVTDSESGFSTSSSGVRNLLYIVSSILEKPIFEVEKKFKDLDYKRLKQSAAEIIIDFCQPIQEKYHSLMSNKDYLESVMKDGNEAAQQRANSTLRKVYEAVGFTKK